MAFEKEQIEAAAGEWEMATYCNRILDEVSATRVSAIQHADYIRSKIAWKYAVLRQSFTYRTVDLIEGTMATWSGKRWLSSLVVGRAAIETVALVHDVEQQMRKLIDAKDIPGLDDLAMKQLHSAKAEDYLLDPKFVTKSILSAVDRLDKQIPALRKYYDTLSEYAHPNAKGHHFFFGKLDKENRVDNFSEEMTGAAGTVRHVTSACLGIIWAQLSFNNMDKMNNEIVAVHEAYIEAEKEKK